MGSKSRKRRKLREMDAMTPLQKSQAQSDFRAEQFRAVLAREGRKPQWVLNVESSGHQYIGGGKPGTSPRGLTNAEKRESRRVWKVRENRHSSRDEGTGKSRRSGEYIAVTGDHGNLGGATHTVPEQRHWERAARLRNTSFRVIADEPVAHTGRHTHTGHCPCCVDESWHTPAVEATDDTQDERTIRADARREQILASREVTYTRGEGATAPSHEMDAHGNIARRW